MNPFRLSVCMLAVSGIWASGFSQSSQGVAGKVHLLILHEDGSLEAAEPAPAARKAGGIPAQRHWLIAGGAAILAGAIVWSVLASMEDASPAKPVDLGAPPSDPVAGQ